MAETIRTSTGVKGLDSLLGGGLPSHAVISIMGAPGSGKTTFIRQLVFKQLQDGAVCVYVATSEPVKHIKDQMKLMGWDTEQFQGKLFFIDSYSWRTQEKPQTAPGLFVLSSAADLNELNRILNQIAKEHKGQKLFFVVDSLSDLVLYSNPESMFKFMQLFVGIVKSGENGAVVVLEQGIHDERVYTTVNYVTDGTIEMKVEGSQRLMRIARMMDTQHPLKWVAFTIGGKGVEVEIEKFFG
jgi:KaiC/GvpD/RAD55 family RecA-like ATPase